MGEELEEVNHNFAVTYPPFGKLCITLNAKYVVPLFRSDLEVSERHQLEYFLANTLTHEMTVSSTYSDFRT